MNVLSITTDGGFTGRGIGSIAIDDSRVTTERGSGVLTPDEQQRLRKLVAKAHPESWKSSYAPADAPHGHPDQVRVTVTVGGSSASFFDASDAPEDLRAIYEAMWAVRHRLVSGAAR